MNKDNVKEAMLDRPYKTQVVLSQYKYEDDLDMGWECDVFYKGEYIGGGTAPTVSGVYDMAQEIVYDYENPSLF